LKWAVRQQERASHLYPVRLAGVALGLWLLFRARRRPPWVTSILSLSLVGLGLVVSCYYWIVFALWALLPRVVPRTEQVVLGALVLAEVIITMPAFSERLDDVYALQSVLYLGLAGILMSWVALPRCLLGSPRTTLPGRGANRATRGSKQAVATER
jgi:hypothetical protein